MFDGSNFTDYAQYLKDFRDYWQSTWETEVGTTVQNTPETVTKHYVVDYLSMANRDILVTEDGRYTQRYVYDDNGKRISAEYDYAENTHRGGSGENFQSDFATQEIEKIWYRTSHLGSTLFTTDTAGEVISHTIYDPWGKPVTYMDANFSGMDVQNNYTGYTYDEVLDIYFAQFRFYNADNHRFTQEDPIKDGENWYVYVQNSPRVLTDPLGLSSTEEPFRQKPSHGSSVDEVAINFHYNWCGFTVYTAYELGTTIYANSKKQEVKSPFLEGENRSLDGYAYVQPDTDNIVPYEASDTYISKKRLSSGQTAVAHIHTHPYGSYPFSGIPGDGSSVISSGKALYLSAPHMTPMGVKARPVITGFGNIRVLTPKHLEGYTKRSSVHAFYGDLIAYEPYRKPTDSEKQNYMLKYGPRFAQDLKKGGYDIESYDYPSLAQMAYEEAQKTGTLPNSVEPMYFEELQCLKTWGNGRVLVYG